MNKKFIRVMALILVLVMVLGMIPVLAHAEEAPVAGSAYTTDVALPNGSGGSGSLPQELCGKCIP